MGNSFMGYPVYQNFKDKVINNLYSQIIVDDDPPDLDTEEGREKFLEKFKFKRDESKKNNIKNINVSYGTYGSRMPLIPIGIESFQDLVNKGLEEKKDRENKKLSRKKFLGFF